MWLNFEGLTLASHMKLILFVQFFYLVILLDLLKGYFIEFVFGVETKMFHLQPQHFVLALLFDLRLITFNIVLTEESIFPLPFNLFNLIINRIGIPLFLFRLHLSHFL